MGKDRFSGKNLDSSFLKSQFPDYFKYCGRKITKKLSKKSIHFLNDHYKNFSLDEKIINFHELKKPNEKYLLISDQFDKINIEIGFGDGEFLLKNALAHPNELFIGSEFYVNGIVKVLKEIEKYKIRNIKLTNLNSLYLIKSIQNNSIDRIFVINPDPWNKKRHHKRRLFSKENLILLNNVTKFKKSIYITTDSINYINSIQEIFKSNKEIFGILDICKLSKNDYLYGVSRYQRKAIEKGGNIYLLRI